MATIDVTTYGVSPAASSTTNRTSFASAMAAAVAGDELYIPDGTYTFNVASLRSILVSKAVTVRGQSKAGTILQIDASLVGQTGSFWRIFEVTAGGATIRDLTIEGRKPNSNTVTIYDEFVEHHSGIFVGPSISGFTLSNVAVRNFEGDGLQIYSAVANPIVEDCDFDYCQRSGMSFTPSLPTLPVTNAIVRRNTYTGMTGQPIDNEHGPVLGCEIYENTFNYSNNNYSLTISGYDDTIGAANRSKNYDVHHNWFGGAVFVIRCESITIRQNTWVNQTTKPCVDISRSAYNILIEDNDMTNVQTTTSSVSVVNAIGTTEPGPVYAFPTQILVSNNRITATGHASSFGVRCEGCHSVVVSGNTITGPGLTAIGFAGVYLRSNIVARDFVSAVVSGNNIRNWGQRGISIVGNSTAEMLYAEIVSNKIGNIDGATAMNQGMSLDDGTGVLQSALIVENTFGAGITNAIVNVGTAEIALAFPAQEGTARSSAFTGLSFVGGWL